MRRLLPLILVAALLAVLPVGTASATNPVLPIPSPLTASWTAPAGIYAPAPTDNVTAACHPCTVDLSAATIIGSGTGYIVKPQNGASVTVTGGNVQNMAGVVLGLVGSGNRATVTIANMTLTNVVSGFLYKTNDGGRVDVTMTNVTGTGMGVGVNTWGSITATGNNLTGGGNPSSGNPAGFHAQDLNTTATPVPDQLVTLTSNTIRGFTTSSFQGDGVVSEETVWRLVAIGNTIGGNSDGDIDTKSYTNLLEGNTFEANAAGSTRLVGAHFGITYSVNNAYAVQSGGAGIEATAGGGPDPTHPSLPGAISNGDTFILADSTALVAKAQVQCSGSTGFAGPRAGNVELDHPTWTPAGGTPWQAISSQCQGVPPTYVTTVTYRP